MKNKIFKTQVFPKFNEFDMYGIMHHMNYFSWFEFSRYKFFHQKDIDLKKLFKDGYSFVLIQSNVRYHKMVDSFDEYFVTCSIDNDKLSSQIILKQNIINKNNILFVSAIITIALVKNKQLVLKIPEEIKLKLKD
ncbi:acyl-CoA thioesterase [Arcobacter vandammei]|uniref:acyl-CoA thioesterase n=1 Tax=Arcobacter vandammei TaxID=2782243 RepID=UPI0018DF1F9D|nr:thioesterase family protein [Arcobacter vandammei]